MQTKRSNNKYSYNYNNNMNGNTPQAFDADMGTTFDFVVFKSEQ